MKKSLLLIISIFLFGACQKVIEIDPFESQSQLVLNAIPSAGKQMFVNFAYSHFFLDTSNYHPVANTDMVITVNGTAYHPSSTHRCNYFFPLTLQEDDSLQIAINAGGHSISASTYVPRFPQVDSLNVFIDSSTAFNILAVRFNIQDHPGYPNYYCFRILERDSGSRYIDDLQAFDTIDTISSTSFLCYDKLLTDNPMASPSFQGFPFYGTLLTTDANFDGRNINTTLMVLLLRDTNEVPPFIHQYELSVECVTPDRYRYLQDLAQASSMTSMITEPPAVYSNVNGALGIFAGNAKHTFPLLTLNEENHIVSTSKSASSKAMPLHICPQFNTLKKSQKQYQKH